jgi:hypothetical protein
VRSKERILGETQVNERRKDEELMAAAATKPKRGGGGDFMSSHRVSLLMPRLTDRRVRQAKELYAPDEQRQGGGGALVGRESGDEHVLDKSALEDGVLVRRAERRVGKKPLVLKAKLESGGSCLVGGTVRIRGLRALSTVSLRVLSLVFSMHSHLNALHLRQPR